MMHPPRFVPSADGTELYVRQWGDPSHPPILLIHGQAQCHLSFCRQTESPLASKYHLVAFDLRGHGASGKPVGDEHYVHGRLWAEDVHAVIGALGLRKPVVAGWSLGGRVIRQYLVRYGDAALGGINFLATRPIEAAHVVGPASRAMAAAIDAEFAERLQAEVNFLLACFQTPPEQDDLLRFVAFNALLPPAVRAAIGRWTIDAEATLAALRAVRVPTLISHGRNDNIILPEAAEMTAACIPHATLSWYECGHAPFYEEAERYNRELDDFASQIRR